MGGFDPLLDDTVDFDCRLRHVGVTSTLRVRRKGGKRIVLLICKSVAFACLLCFGSLNHTTSLSLSLPPSLQLGRDLPHGFFGLFGMDKVATGIMEEAGQFLQRNGGKEGGSEGGGGTVVLGGGEGGGGNGGGEKVFCDVEAAVGGGGGREGEALMVGSSST